MIPDQDIDNVGFDNVPVAEINHPPLTTVSSFPQRMGKEAANLCTKKMVNIDHE
ncbi:substrate-binding domain-containing protein [Peribacillus sp. NPDC006672]|uniref:substrate-binding domain-containing protein n=1 Tax=Peribacillus sp. NPDC006672 TaxID=3390606 RepID=UPI003CFF1B7C